MLGALLLALTVPLDASGTVPAGPEYIEGVARAPEDGRELYRERHAIGALDHEIDYLAPDGRRIARNTLDYRQSDSAPDFEQHDLRHGTRVGGRWQGGVYQLLRDRESRALRAPEATLVASSGFDRFVRAQWEPLLRNEAVEVEFAVPARLQSIALRIARIEAPQPLPESALWLRIVPVQPLLRAFVAPIVLAYDAERRLLLYRGVSNLDDADGNAQQVEIRYRPLDPAAQQTLPEKSPSPDEPPSAALRTTAHSYRPEALS